MFGGSIVTIMDSLFDVAMNVGFWSFVLIALIFVFVGWANVPPILSYLLAFVICLTYIIAATRGAVYVDATPSAAFAAKVGVAACLSFLPAAIYWAARNKMKPAAPQIVQKPAAKKIVKKKR